MEKTMIKIAIHGTKYLGKYRVECECGGFWEGGAQRMGRGIWNPAMPIAEAIAHMSLVHTEERADIVMSAEFQAWLLQYWDWATTRLVSQMGVAF